MKRLFILLALFISFSVSAIEYQFDVNTNEVTYSWVASETDKASFHKRMTGFGVTGLINDNWAFRVGAMKGGEAGTKGRYHTFKVDMKFIVSYELMYRKSLTDNISAFAGVGSYRIPVPIYSEVENYYRNDSDDDEGWFLGLNARMYGDWFINYRYTKYSTINSGSLKESIRGSSIQLIYEF